MVIVLENYILILMYLANAIVLLSAFLWGLYKKRIYSVLWGALFLFHMASLSKFEFLLGEFSFNTFFLGQGLMLVSNSLLLATCILFDSILLRGFLSFENVRSWLITPHPSKRRYLILIGVVSLAIIAFQLRDGMERVFIGWEEARGSVNIVDSFAILLSFIVFPCVWVAFRSKLYFLTLLLGLLCLSIFLIIGSRAVLLTLLAAAYIELLLADLTLRKKLSIIVLMGLLGFGLHTLSRLTRGPGLVGIVNIIMNGELTAKMGGFESIDLSGGESNIYRYYNYVIDRNYDHYPYHAWITVKRLVLLYLPTGWVPDIKPIDITYQLYSDAFADGIFNQNIYYNRMKALAEAGQTGSIHPTLWGDAYANGGIAGIVIYPFFLGLILVMMDRYTRKLSPVGIFMIVPLTIVGYLMIARGNVVIGFGYWGYIIPMAIVLAYSARLSLFAKKNRENLRS